ncbi:MAG: fasciclin domain-containing protein [Bacteroidota bacterium]|nr:fasciclin domain-containing protein [Bacteroidota bacterium]
MKNSFKKIAGLLMIAAIAGTSVNAQTKKSMTPTATVVVGGEAMFPKKNIVENAVNSKDHTTLVAAVKAADLVATLQTAGPFTVFAPVNDAFENLPAGTVETILKPENKATLVAVLTYHVISGTYDFNALKELIKKGNGTGKLKTVQGEELWVMMNGEHNIQIKDAKGNVANISTYDVYQSNGVIHVIDKVLMPSM